MSLFESILSWFKGEADKPLPPEPEPVITGPEAYQEQMAACTLSAHRHAGRAKTASMNYGFLNDDEDAQDIAWELCISVREDLLPSVEVDTGYIIATYTGKDPDNYRIRDENYLLIEDEKLLVILSIQRVDAMDASIWVKHPEEGLLNMTHNAGVWQDEAIEMIKNTYLAHDKIAKNITELEIQERADDEKLKELLAADVFKEKM